MYQDGGSGSTVQGTPGAALVDGLERADGEPIVVKRRFSPFFHTHLDLILRRCVVSRFDCIETRTVHTSDLALAASSSSWHGV